MTLLHSLNAKRSRILNIRANFYSRESPECLVRLFEKDVLIGVGISSSVAHPLTCFNKIIVC